MFVDRNVLLQQHCRRCECSLKLFPWNTFPWQCSQCDVGTYSGITGQTSCVKCAAGKFLVTQGAKSSDRCQNCDIGSFSSALGFSGTCAICLIGTHATTKGLTACTACNPGTYIDGNSPMNCKGCTAGAQFQSLPGQSTCKQCTSRSCSISGQTLQSCTTTLDSQCNSCKPYENCIYTNNTVQCTRNINAYPPGYPADIPNCFCTPGFQMDTSSKKCVQCPSGKWKGATDNSVCEAWDNQQCSPDRVAVQGTRTTNSACIPFPALAPDNAVVNGGRWECIGGYEPTTRF